MSAALALMGTVPALAIDTDQSTGTGTSEAPLTTETPVAPVAPVDEEAAGVAPALPDEEGQTSAEGTPPADANGEPGTETGATDEPATGESSVEGADVVDETTEGADATEEPAAAPASKKTAAPKLASDAVALAGPAGSLASGTYNREKDNSDPGGAGGWVTGGPPPGQVEFGNFVSSATPVGSKWEYSASWTRPGSTGNFGWTIEYTVAGETWGPSGLEASSQVPRPDRSEGGTAIKVDSRGTSATICTYSSQSDYPSSWTGSNCATIPNAVSYGDNTVTLDFMLPGSVLGQAGCPPEFGSLAYLRGWTGSSMNLVSWVAPAPFDPPSTCPSIVMMKGDLRTSLDSGGINVASTYTEGAQFALYTSETSTDAVDTCTITVPADGCRFGAVTQTGKLWVGEIDPVPGSPAALHYSAPLGSLATGTLGAYTERSYRYATPVITSTTTGTITLPEASGRNTGGGWAASSQRYANRLLNPNLELDCAVGINVALVMDLSGSVAQAGAADTLRDAALGFVDALEGSGSSVALISFGNASPRAGTTNQTIPLQVDDAAQRAVINDTIQQYRDHTVRDQGTNWDAGMWEASQEAASYDIVFVLTDGNPTFSGTSPDGSGSLTTFAELERAVFSANAIKEAGARVITVGIGDGLSDSNLAAVSGPVPFTSGETLDQFDFINTDWQALQTVLKNFGAHLGCSADVTVTKLAGENSATPAPAAGWTFTAAAEGATLSPAAAQETNEAGQASWRVALPGVNAEAAVTLTETQRADAGWELTDLACTVNGTPLPLDVGLSATVSGVVAGDDVQCTYTNVKRNATLTLVKEVNNQYGGTGTPGDWQLTAAGDTKTLTGATGEDAVTAVQVPLGEYALSEADGPAGYDPSAWACVDAGSDPAQTLTTTGGTVTLPAGGQVTCTITNSDLPGAVTWSKTAAIGGDLLAGSEWKIDGSTAISTLTDCDEAPCPAGGDQDPAAGAFSLTGLAWGEYEVTETKAPPGYVGGASFTFTVSGDTAGSVIAIGDVTNDQQAGVALPLTGGVSREMITLGGAAVALLALIAGALYTVRRRARAEAV